MLRYTSHATDIVAYTYRADTYCPDCILFAMGATKRLPYLTVEGALDEVAGRENVDRQDEWTFDSDNFPKVVFSSQVEGVEFCGGCGREIA